MKVRLNAIFLMSVLLLGIVGYPSSQLNSENIDVNDNFLFAFSNIAYADEDEDDEREDEDDEHDDKDKYLEERDDEDKYEDDREDEDEYEVHDDEYVEHEDEESEEVEFEIKGIVELVDPLLQFINLTNGKQIYVDGSTEFENFESLSDLLGFAVEVEVVTSNSSLVATEIEKEHEDEKDDEHDEADEIEEELEIEIEVEVEGMFAKVKVEFNDKETKFVQEFVDNKTLAGVILDEVDGLPWDVDKIIDEWDLKIKEDDKPFKTTHEDKKESLQTALDLLQELQQKIEQLENRIQTLLDKYESGEYFGVVPEADSEISSYTISFEGSATSMDDESTVDAKGQIFMENLRTIDDNIFKFRVTGGDITVDDTFYEIAFGKARVSSADTSGEKDTIVLLGQIIDFADEDDDSTTIKLVIDSETSLEGDFGIEPIGLEILPQSKIAGQWYLSGSGELSILED